jgi:ATP-binding cassette subfamily B protein
VTGILRVLFVTNARLAAIALLPMIPLILIAADFGRRIGGFFLHVDRALGDLSARLQENVSGVQVVRAFAREPYEMERFGQANRALYHGRVRVVSEWAKIMPTTQALIAAGTILILWFGGQMALSGELTIGALVAFNSYLLMLGGPAQELTWLVNAAGEAVAGAARLEVLDTRPISSRRPRPCSSRRSRGGWSSRTCVSIQRREASALQEIELAVEPNQVIALIASTGRARPAWST